jgi:acyl-CoA synthetase (AMP-forming)/AMP-acid ligase II
VLMTHPKVAMAAVVGIPDHTLGEKVAAVVVLKPESVKDGGGLTLTELKDFCNGKLAAYKVPKELVVKDSLPMSGAGKILKHEVRKLIGAVGSKVETQTKYQ